MTDQEEAAVVMQFRLRPESVVGFGSEVARLAQTLADVSATGYLGRRDHFDVAGCEPTIEWLFTSLDLAAQWSRQPAVRDFMVAVGPMTDEPPVMNVVAENPGERPGAATLVVTTAVKPGADAWFAEWQGRVGAAEQVFPGFIGQRVLAPVPGANPDWVSVVAFDSDEHLQQWTDSSERKALVDESEPYVQRYDVRPASSAFESWFAKDETGGKPPPAWKLSAIVLLVLYPVVMLEFFTVNHLTQDEWTLDPALGVFIGNAISVAITGFILIPWASSLLKWWLVPPDAKARQRTWLGSLVVLVFYAVSVAVFWLLIAAFPHLMP